MADKKQDLMSELVKYEKKLAQLRTDWGETRGGSRYGDEYGEVQIKVYQKMIEEVKVELSKLK